MDGLPLDVKKYIFALAGGDLGLALHWRLVCRSWCITAKHFVIAVHVRSIRRSRGRARLRGLHRVCPSLTQLHVGSTRRISETLPAFTNLRTLSLGRCKECALATLPSHPCFASLTALTMPFTPTLLPSLVGVTALSFLHLIGLKFAHRTVQAMANDRFAWPALPVLTELRAENGVCVHLSPLSSLTALRTLILKGVRSSGDERLPTSLTTLELKHACWPQWNPSSAPTALTSLRLPLSRGDQRSLAVFTHLTGLRLLHLSCFNDRALDWRPLCSFVQLEGTLPDTHRPTDTLAHTCSELTLHRSPSL